jgi:hypothetical protein
MADDQNRSNKRGRMNTAPGGDLLEKFEQIGSRGHDYSLEAKKLEDQIKSTQANLDELIKTRMSPSGAAIPAISSHIAEAETRLGEYRQQLDAYRQSNMNHVHCMA